jgi:flagella basal body P-ring formation protein FlgA
MKRPSSPLAAMLVGMIGAMVMLRAEPALAGTPVDLRRDLASGSQITLGDLFDGAGGAGAVVVGNGAPAGLDAVLDAAVVASNASGIRRIIVRSQATAATAPGERAGRPGQTIQVLTYARSLMAGELIRPEDLTFSAIPSFQAPQDAPRGANEVIGKIARLPLRSGAPVSVHDVSSVQVIKRDDLIEVAYHAEGISLVMQAKAMSAAAVGDTLSVMNPRSNKLIQAVAVGPDQAVVGPEAAEIKAAAYPNLSLLADNR